MKKIWNRIRQKFLRDSARLSEKARAIIDSRKKFGPRVFIETGTYLGDTLAAVKDAFDTCISIELDPALHARARTRFATDSRVQLRQGDSAQVLPEILRELREP